MARPNQAAKSKRDRERSRQEWQQHKQEKKAQRSESRKDRERLVSEGIDPDLAGIIPGPQPISADDR